MGRFNSSFFLRDGGAPEGKMKSREGTVVDADDLVAEMINTARNTSDELGKLEGYLTKKKKIFSGRWDWVLLSILFLRLILKRI